MANLALLASGTGSNFQAIATAVSATHHRVVCLICDRKDAAVLQKGKARSIPSHHVTYAGREREEAEREILHLLREYRTDIVALAGFMRVLTPQVVDAYHSRIVNIHPSLLPSHPGVGAIEKSFKSGDTQLGVTVHYVDYGTDTGPVILQKSFTRRPDMDLTEAEELIHRLEHTWYPQVVISLLDAVTGKGTVEGETSESIDTRPGSA